MRNPYKKINVKGKTIYVHRLIAAQVLGRELLPGESVHHLNGDKTDNAINNLAVFSSRGEHQKHHLSKHDWLKGRRWKKSTAWRKAQSELMKKRWQEGRYKNTA